MSRKIIGALIGLALGLALVLTLGFFARLGDLTQAIRNSQQDRVPVLNETHRAAQQASRTAKRVESCTTPGKPCYERGVRQQTRAIRQLIVSNRQAAAAAAACAAALPDHSFQAVYRCTVKTLNGN